MHGVFDFGEEEEEKEEKEEEEEEEKEEEEEDNGNDDDDGSIRLGRTINLVQAQTKWLLLPRGNIADGHDDSDSEIKNSDDDSDSEIKK